MRNADSEYKEASHSEHERQRRYVRKHQSSDAFRYVNRPASTESDPKTGSTKRHHRVRNYWFRDMAYLADERREMSSCKTAETPTKGVTEALTSEMAR